jgi:protein MPE1
MVNAEGDWVIAEPDKASWDNYQAKARVSAAAREAAALGSKDLQEKGLECSIDKRLFEEPTKTPCCQNTYCHDCITNALLENDLHCPNCSTENILIDSLEPDHEMVVKIRRYEEDQAANELKEDISNNPTMEIPLSKSQMKPASSSANNSPRVSLILSDSAAVCTVRKRPAEAELKNDRIPSNSSRQDPNQHPGRSSGHQYVRQQPGPFFNGHQTLLAKPNFTMAQGINMMPIFPMAIAPPMPMDQGTLNAMMMQGLPFMGGHGGWANSWGAGVSQHSSINANALSGSSKANGGYAQQPYYGSMVNDFIDARTNNQGSSGFSNQQQTAFSTQALNEEDSAYFRKPVNPHRHLARRNLNRPTDYREI